MKTKVQYLWRPVLASLILLPIISGVAWAANDPAQSTTLVNRMALRTDKYNVTLSNAQKSRVIGKCVAAQAVLKNVSAKSSASAQARQDVYTKLVSQLNALIDKLNQQNANDSALKAMAGQFNSAVSQYLTDTETYKAALDDSIVMDCKADPVGFKVTILDARTQRAQLAKDAQGIKTTATDIVNNLNAISKDNGAN